MAISLKSAINTCKVNTGDSNKYESSRFLNPNNVVCPTWTGHDSTGRDVCPYSYNAKSAGCQSAEDRISVENSQRPQYIEYVNLSSLGIEGEGLYGGAGSNEAREIYKHTGDFGTQLTHYTHGSCNNYDSYSNFVKEERHSADPLASRNTCSRYNRDPRFYNSSRSRTRQIKNAALRARDFKRTAGI